MDCIVMLPTDFCHACETRESNLTLYLVFCTGRFCPLFWCLHSEPPFEGPSVDGEADFLSPLLSAAQAISCQRGVGINLNKTISAMGAILPH